MSDLIQRYHPRDGGGFIISAHQDVEPILENNKEWQKVKQTSELRRTASIPLVIWLQWINETGGLLDRMPVAEQAAFVKRKLADPGYAYLRTT